MDDRALQQRQELQVSHHVQIELSWKSILRLLAGVLLSYVAIELWPICKMLILAILIAIGLNPIVAWAQRKAAPHWVGVLLAVATLILVIVGCAGIIAPLIFNQLTTLGENLPKLREQIIAQLPSTGMVRQALENGMGPGTVADSRVVLQKLVLLLGATLGEAFYLVVVVVLALYLLIEGPRALRWLIVFFPSAQREKIWEALGQVSRLISSYLTGQCVVSLFCSIYLFLILKLLGVPMALLLGIFAGICDVLPIVGFFVAVILSMGMALTVSPGTAVSVGVLYGAYHLFENFFIVPRVYGKRLRLSKLAVPLAVAAGAVLAGVVGAIAVLPLVAAYPVVERLWLAPKLQPDALKAHEEGNGEGPGL